MVHNVEVDDGVDLAELIRRVRGELSLAMWEGESKDLRFELGPIELDLELVVERSTAPGAKARLLVVDVEASHQRRSAVTHRIKLTLSPRQPAKPDRPPWISGQAEEGEE